jgi:hypothetical protein
MAIDSCTNTYRAGIVGIILCYVETWNTSLSRRIRIRPWPVNVCDFPSVDPLLTPLVADVLRVKIASVFTLCARCPGF